MDKSKIASLILVSVLLLLLAGLSVGCAPAIQEVEAGTQDPNRYG
jgi:hypothetical protein